MSAAAEAVNTCVQQRHRLLMVGLMDVSKSLRNSDKPGLRVDGLRALLTGLDRTREDALGGPVRIDVALMGFSGAVVPSATDVLWQPLDETSIGGLLQAADTYRHRNTGHNTDYAGALYTARTLVASRVSDDVAKGEQAPCAAVVMFGDGGFEIHKALPNEPVKVDYDPDVRIDSDSGAAAAMESGRTVLCSPSGVMDSFADDGVTTFAIGLSSPDAHQDGRDFLQALMTGRSGKETCGTRRSARAGAYVDATDDDVMFAFAHLLTPRPTTAGPLVRCTEPNCPGSKSFEVTPGISGFVLRTGAFAPGDRLQLSTPSKETATLTLGQVGTVHPAGATVAQQWRSSASAEIQGSFPASATSAQGSWTWWFINQSGKPGPAPRSEMTLRTSLRPVLTDRPRVTAGQTNVLQVEMQDAAGQSAGASPLAQQASLTAAIIDPLDGTSQTLETTPGPRRGTFAIKVPVPADLQSQSLTLNLLSHFPAQGDASVEPRLRSYSLTAFPPPGDGVPRVKSATLSLPSLRGDGTVKTEIEVIGDAHLPGCAWIGPQVVRAPREAGAVRADIRPQADSAAKCLPIAAGTSRSLEIEVRVPRSASGAVHLNVPVHVLSARLPQGRVVAVTVRGELAPPINVIDRAAIIIALLVAGGVVPFLVLFVANQAGARLSPPQNLRALVVDVVVKPGDGVCASKPPLLVDDYLAFRRVSDDGAPHTARHLEFGGLTVKARAPIWMILAGPHAEVTADGAMVLAGPGDRLRPRRGGTAHDVPLSLAEVWMFHVTAVYHDADPILPSTPDGVARGPSSVEGQLVLVIAEGGDHERAGGPLFRKAEASLARQKWPQTSAPSRKARARLRPRFRRSDDSATTPADASTDTPGLGMHDPLFNRLVDKPNPNN